MTNLPVIHNESARQFEIHLDGNMALLEYQDRNDTLVIIHTEVPEAFEGQGIGSMLASYTLDWARTSGKKLKVYCAFVKAYMERHPEYNDLLVI